MVNSSSPPPTSQPLTPFKKRASPTRLRRTCHRQHPTQRHQRQRCQRCGRPRRGTLDAVDAEVATTMDRVGWSGWRTRRLLRHGSTAPEPPRRWGVGGFASLNTRERRFWRSRDSWSRIGAVDVWRGELVGASSRYVSYQMISRPGIRTIRPFVSLKFFQNRRISLFGVLFA